MEPSIDNPKSDAGRQNGKHLEGQVARGSCVPALLELWEIRDRGAKSSYEAHYVAKCISVNAVTIDRFRMIGAFKRVRLQMLLDDLAVLERRLWLVGG